MWLCIRRIRATVTAGLVSVLPWLLVAAVDLRIAALEPPCEVDCVSNHFGGFLLLTTPFVFLIAASVSFVVGSALAKGGAVKPTPFLRAAVVASLILAAPPTVWLSQPWRFGFRDVLPWLAVWSVLIGIGALLAATAWWWLAAKPQNLQLSADASADRQVALPERTTL